MTHADSALASRFLDTIERDIVPLTRAAVAGGNRVFGAAVLRKRDLALVVAGTNRASENPLLHGEIATLNAFFALPAASRPAAADCLFLSTHEPCPMCLSAVAWAGFDNIHYAFSYEETRDAFGMAADLEILREVFRIGNGGYSRHNAFWRCRSLDELIGGGNDDSSARLRRLRAVYGELFSLYRAAAGRSAP